MKKTKFALKTKFLSAMIHVKTPSARLVRTPPAGISVPSNQWITYKGTKSNVLMKMKPVKG